MDIAEDQARSAALAALERLVIENDDLLALESLIGRFNIFDALDIARVEIRHSNFLAFILDPSESHGQGQLFLRALLMDLLKAAPTHLRPLSPIELDGTDLRGVEIKREWGHIDLLISCQHPAFLVVIENKVDATEHSDQLSRYAATVLESHPSARALYVYLTPSGEEPSKATWIPYSYADVHRVLSRVRNTYRNAIGDDVLVFLDHYLNLIGTRFMNDPKIDELCQRIYKNHRQALQLIFERVGSPAAGALAEIESVVRADKRWHVFYRSAGYIDFAPTSWLEWLPKLGLDYEDARSWIVFRFDVYRGQLDYYVQVGRIADVARRRQIIDVLLEHGEQFEFKRKGARVVKDNYTRVSSRERILAWGEDGSADPEAIRSAVQHKLDAVFPKLNGVADTLRPVLDLIIAT